MAAGWTATTFQTDRCIAVIRRRISGNTTLSKITFNHTWKLKDQALIRAHLKLENSRQSRQEHLGTNVPLPAKLRSKSEASINAFYRLLFN